jgi:hypothetical protein
MMWRGYLLLAGLTALIGALGRWAPLVAQSAQIAVTGHADKCTDPNARLWALIMSSPSLPPGKTSNPQLIAFGRSGR